MLNILITMLCAIAGRYAAVATLHYPINIQRAQFPSLIGVVIALCSAGGETYQPPHMVSLTAVRKASTLLRIRYLENKSNL
jgi:hypothetical protein